MKKEQIVKIAIIVLVSVVTIYVLWRFGKNIYYKWKSRQNAKELEQSIDAKKLSYDNAQYESFAKTLYNAMKGPGTDEEKIQSVFSKMETRSDVLKLIAVYGIKDGETLEEWIDGDLDSDDKDEYINKVLEAKQIDYVF